MPSFRFFQKCPTPAVLIVVVAGVRSVHSRRQDDEIVSFGTWRIEMIKAMRSYVSKKERLTLVPPEPPISVFATAKHGIIRDEELGDSTEVISQRIENCVRERN